MEVSANKELNQMNTCTISGASGPHMEAPTTLSVSASTSSFMAVFSCRLEPTIQVRYMSEHNNWKKK